MSVNDLRLKQDSHVTTCVLGCGTKPMEGAHNVDCRPLPGVTHIQDLNAGHWELPEDQYDLVICERVLEHMKDRLAFLDEVRRIARKDATVIIDVPHWKHIFAHSCLEHRWLFTHQSFNPHYSIDGKFERIRTEYWMGKRLIRNETLGRWLAKYTGLIDGLRFYIRVVK